MKKREVPVLGMPGTSSLMVIFAVLCIAVFAVLALSGVQASQRLETASENSVKEYYAADCRAQEILAEIRAGHLPDGVETDGGEYSYTCPISDTRDLLVKVSVKGNEFKILQWQARYSAEWEAEESLDIWSGK